MTDADAAISERRPNGTYRRESLCPGNFGGHPRGHLQGDLLVGAMKQILIFVCAVPFTAMRFSAGIAAEDTNSVFRATISPVTDEYHGQWQVALAEFSPGRVIAIWEAGHTEVRTPNVTLAAESADGGRTWSGRREFHRSAGVRSVPCGFYCIKDLIHCVIAEVPMVGGSQSRRVLDRATSDRGVTWGAAREIWRTKSGIAMQPVVLRDGRIALPVYQRVAGSDRKPTSLASVLISKDDGATWQPGAAIPTDLPGGAMEPTLAETSDGGWLCIVRTRGTGVLYASRSQDDGQTWEPAAPLPLESPESIARLERLADGSLLLVWNGVASRTQGPRDRLTVARSLDGGRTWPQRRDLVKGGPVFSNHGVLQLVDGRILVGYQHFHRDPARAPDRSGVDSVELAAFDLHWLATQASRK